MGFLLFLLLAYLVLSFALTQVFAKAKETEPSLPLEPKDGWIPGVNFAKWCHLIGRKPVYALWLLVPLVNVFIYAGMCVDLARSFGFVRFRDAIGAVIAAPLYFLWRPSIGPSGGFPPEPLPGECLQYGQLPLPVPE